jgi:tRNA 2-thiouridine synthesizing protein C
MSSSINNHISDSVHDNTNDNNTNGNIQQRIAIINSQVPYANNAGKDALDVALIYASYEQQVSLFFHGDGVWQLVPQQSPETIQQKNYLKTFAAFDLYDIEHVYVCQQSLNERALPAQFHIDNVTILPQADFNQYIAQHAVILRF